MTKKKHSLLAIVSCILLLAMAIGFTSLYLTDNDTATNTVTVGDIKIDLLEPSWHDTYDVVPNQELPKDPQIKNTGVNDAVVFMTVQVPVEEITLTSDDGTKGVKAPSELFWFKDTADGASTHANNFDSNWVHLDTKDTGVDLSGSSRTYVFAYKTPLAANQTTSPLFDKIQVKNFIENEIAAGTTEQIIINAYGIQASDILENNVDLSDNLTNGNLNKIYDIFLKQAFNSTVPTAPTTPAVEHENYTYNVENVDVQTFMATPAYDANDYSYTNMVNSSAFTVARPDRPATCEITVPSGASSITITDSTTGKVVNDTISGDTYTLVNYTPGQVLNYVVTNASNTPVKDGTITVEGNVRMIDGGGNTFNIRDIGGWTADGGTLKYGKVYRGSELNGNTYGVTLTDSQKSYLKNTLGVSAELDFRESDEKADGNVGFAENIAYSGTPIQAYNDAIRLFTDTGIADAFTAFANNVKNGNIQYIHCAAGADRTGTFTALVEAICGVNQSDIDKEYELTSFANFERNRNVPKWEDMYARISLMGKDNLRDNAVLFLLKLGVPLSDINAVRNALIDGTPTQLVDNDFALREVFDVNTATFKSRIKSDGSVVDYNNGFVVSDFIKINKFSQINISSDKAINTNTGAVIAFYDSNKNLIQGYTWNSTIYEKAADKKSAVTYMWKAPNNETIDYQYVRYCLPYTDINNVSIKVR